MAFTVLIVDDDPDIIDLLEGILKKNGYQTECAQNGLDCLKKVKKNPPDLILMDIMMPILDGIKTLESLYRDNVKNKSIPVIMVSGYIDEENTKIARGLGAKDVVSKPFEQQKLLKIIDSYRPTLEEPRS